MKSRNLSVNILKYREHSRPFLDEEVTSNFLKENYIVSFRKRRGNDLPCYSINPIGASQKQQLTTGYFIGVDWIDTHSTAICVSPKLNKDHREIDFTKMLFDSLRHTEVSKEIDELFEVKWDQPTIEIEQKQDLLTPFIVVEFLSLLKNIVRKGLKKSYYKVENNLNGRVKGKVLVSKTIKHNLMNNKNLFTYCSYDEFGINNKENRLLKKALVFVKRYLPIYTQFKNQDELQNTFNYINPAFDKVNENINLLEIKHTKTNVFYKDYDQALRLAKLILKRFGYNISNTVKQKIKTPPFWIDMSKLFELYVLGLLKDRFHKKVHFQYSTYGNELDYLLNSDDYKIVIDAKYKIQYIDGKVHDDIRQVSGYARLNKVYNELNIEEDRLIDCLIIFPDPENGKDNLEDVNLKEIPIPEYKKIYKVGVKLPVI